MCGEHAAVRGILESLPGDDAISIIDMGASPEPFSRGTLTPVDRLVLVVEPYFKALEAAGRMAGLAAQLEIPEVGMVANKVRRPEHRDAIEAYAEEKGVPLWGVVPFDEAFVDADLRGVSILDRPSDDSPALEQLERLASFLTGQR